MPPVKLEGRVTRSSSNASTGINEDDYGPSTETSIDNFQGGRRQPSVPALLPTRVSSRTARNALTSQSRNSVYQYEHPGGQAVLNAVVKVDDESSVATNSSFTSTGASARRGGGGGGGGSAKKATIPGFLTKTYEIFSSAEHKDLCGWGARGDTIVIKKVPEFAARVLPR